MGGGRIGCVASQHSTAQHSTAQRALVPSLHTATAASRSCVPMPAVLRFCVMRLLAVFQPPLRPFAEGGRFLCDANSTLVYMSNGTVQRLRVRFNNAVKDLESIKIGKLIN